MNDCITIFFFSINKVIIFVFLLFQFMSTTGISRIRLISNSLFFVKQKLFRSENPSGLFPEPPFASVQSPNFFPPTPFVRISLLRGRIFKLWMRNWTKQRLELILSKIFHKIWIAQRKKPFICANEFLRTKNNISRRNYLYNEKIYFWIFSLLVKGNRIFLSDIVAWNFRFLMIPIHRNGWGQLEGFPILFHRFH